MLLAAVGLWLHNLVQKLTIIVLLTTYLPIQIDKLREHLKIRNKCVEDRIRSKNFKHKSPIDLCLKVLLFYGEINV
jgi:hypothetical protein